jgi:hypothetical protein
MLVAESSGWQSFDLSAWRIMFFAFERSPQESSSAIGTGIFLVAAGFGAVNVLLSRTIPSSRMAD